MNGGASSASPLAVNISRAPVRSSQGRSRHREDARPFPGSDVTVNRPGVRDCPSSLSKGFGAAGGFLASADRRLVEEVELLGPALTFSAPIRTAGLAAASAAAEVVLSEEGRRLREPLAEDIGYVQDGFAARGVTPAASEETPIWFVKVGLPEVLDAAVRQVLAAGVYVNPASYPAVGLRDGGLRFTQTVALGRDRIDAVLDALETASVPEGR